MSESNNNSTKATTSMPHFTEEEIFLRVWSQFYARATSIVNAPSNEEKQKEKEEIDPQKQLQTIIGVLNATTKILFGLDCKKKSCAVSYGMGVLELSIALHKSGALVCQETESKKEGSASLELDLATLKSIKCIVVRNPVGRSRCRLAGVFDWLENNILQQYLLADIEEGEEKTKVAVIVEEALTTLAAICLGDDLNALQGAAYLHHYVDKASKLFSPEKYASMNQKIVYLRALFDATCKEEGDLVQSIQKNEQNSNKGSSEQLSFFKILVTAETAICEAEKSSKEKTFDKVKIVAKYNEAEKNIDVSSTDFPVKSNGLLDHLRCRIYVGRAAALLRKNGEGGEPSESDADVALRDADALLKVCGGAGGNGDELMAANRFRADALILLGRKKEAQEALSKVLAASPGDEELRSKFEKLISS